MEDQLITARIKALMVAAYTMAAVIGLITCAMVVGLFVEGIDNEKVFGLLGYVMTSVVSAVAGSYATLMGMKGELQIIESNDPEPEPQPAPPKTYDDPNGTVFIDTPDDEDDMAPWEKHRHDLRWDVNGDGVVDESDFPDWRSAGK